MLAIPLYGDLCGTSIEKSVDILALFDCNVHRPERIRFALNHLIAYPSTGRGNTGDDI